MAVADLVQTAVSFAIGCVFGGLVAFRVFVGVVTSPGKLFKHIERTAPPSCLRDPSLGTHHYVQLKNVRLHYVANGEEGKPLMLFVHGFPEFWYSWRYQLKEFSKDYRVVAVDQRGYNDSEKPSGIGNYNAAYMVDDLKQLITALGYKSCVLVGHDWGGAVCWAFATVNKEMVDKLVIMNCPHRAAFARYMRSHRSQFMKSWYMYFFQLPWLPEFYLRFNDYNMLTQAYTGPEMGVRSNKFTQDDLEAYKYALSKQGAATSAINYYRAAFRKLNRDATMVEVPVKLIWGCQDGALERGLAEASKKYVKDLSLSYIEEASHWVQMDQPETVNGYIREFLKK